MDLFSELLHYIERIVVVVVIIVIVFDVRLSKIFPLCPFVWKCHNMHSEIFLDYLGNVLFLLPALYVWMIVSCGRKLWYLRGWEMCAISVAG